MHLHATISTTLFALAFFAATPACSNAVSEDEADANKNAISGDGAKTAEKSIALNETTSFSGDFVFDTKTVKFSVTRIDWPIGDVSYSRRYSRLGTAHWNAQVGDRADLVLSIEVAEDQIFRFTAKAENGDVVTRIEVRDGKIDRLVYNGRDAKQLHLTNVGNDGSCSLSCPGARVLECYDGAAAANCSQAAKNDFSHLPRGCEYDIIFAGSSCAELKQAGP